MEGLRDLYQEVILDHSKKPRNLREIENTAHHAKGHNPLCGDRVTVYVVLEDGKIVDVSFQGDGCAISTASASMMTEGLKGKTMDEAEALFGKFHDLVTGKLPAGEGTEDLGKLAVFAGVQEFPIRVKCATLAWHTLQAAIDAQDEVVTTE